MLAIRPVTTTTTVPDSPPLTPPGSLSTNTTPSPTTPPAPDARTSTINPLYTQLHPEERKSQLRVNTTTNNNLKTTTTTMQTPRDEDVPSGGVLLEQVRSGSTMTITPKDKDKDPTRREDSQHQRETSHSTTLAQRDESDGATRTRVSHDEKDHFKTRLHSFKLDARDKLARRRKHHDRDPKDDDDPPRERVDKNVTRILNRPLENDDDDEEEYESGDDTETENETGGGGNRLARVDTTDSQGRETTTTTGASSFYSAESDLDGAANSTVESLTTRSESPMSFTVDGTSPPRLQNNGRSNGGIDRSPVAYAPGYVHTNSRLVPNIPSSPTPTCSSTSPKLSSSPRLSIPLPYVSSPSSSSSQQAPPPPPSNNRLVPTASIVKPSTSHPSLLHLSSTQTHSPLSSSSNHVPPTRRASTTSPTLHPPPTSFHSSSSSSSTGAAATRRGSSGSTLLLRPNNSQPLPPHSSTNPNPPPTRSLSTSQLLPPSTSSSQTISQSLLLQTPQHSFSYPPPLSSSPSQSPSLSRNLSQIGTGTTTGGGNVSIHDDVENSIRLQAEQIRRQRFEKRQQAEFLAASGGSIKEPFKEKGKSREGEENVITQGGGGGVGRNQTMRRGSQQRHLSVGSSSTPAGVRSRSGSSGLGLGMSSSSMNGIIGISQQQEIEGGGGGSALSTTSLALPLPLPPTSSNGTTGVGGTPGPRTSSLPHQRSGSGGSSLLGIGVRERTGSGGTAAVGVGEGAAARRSVSGDSMTLPPPVGLPTGSTTTTLAPPPPSVAPRTTGLQRTDSTTTTAALTIPRSPSFVQTSGLLQRTHSQAIVNPAAAIEKDKYGGDKDKEEGGGGGTAIPLVGNLIGTDHENYVLMYNMLTGIRIGVSRCQAKAARPLTDADYTARHKFSFDIVGNELTPSVRYDFKFKDYAPWVFRELREYFFLDPSDYLISLTAKYILSELGSPGKSGSFFYFSRDYRFIIKTIRHSEHKFLRKILKEYHEHVKKNPHTLLSRFYGLHRVKLPHGRKIHFVIMNNLFPPHRDIHETYDLKGSSVGRLYPESKAAQNPHAVLKDLNWIVRNRHLDLGPEKKALFEEQLRRDTELMQKLGIMDYSLLTGVHMAAKGNEERLREGKLSVFQPDAPKPTRKPTQVHRSADASALRAAVQRSDPQSITSGQDLPEHDTSTERRRFLFYQDEGGMRATGEANEDLAVIYYLGIIDILTPYTLVKRLEHFFKGIKNDKHCISAVPPKEYGDRFLLFIRSCIRGNPQSLRPKMWMPPIDEEGEVQTGPESTSQGLVGESGNEREKNEESRGKEKVQ